MYVVLFHSVVCSTSLGSSSIQCMTNLYVGKLLAIYFLKMSYCFTHGLYVYDIQVHDLFMFQVLSSSFKFIHVSGDLDMQFGSCIHVPMSKC